MRVLDWRTLAQHPTPAEYYWRYGLLVEDIEAEGFHCESYGLMVTDARTGQSAKCRHVTVNAAQAVELLEKLARCEVTSDTLRDVVEDWLGQ